MKFKWITSDAPEYEEQRLLRWEVLFKPHGIPPDSETLQEETEGLHLIALENRKIVGCVCFHPESAHHGRIFEVAISEEYEGDGFGRKLLHTLEEKLIEKGVQNVYLFARPENEDFYNLMGYSAESETISHMGLDHKKMKKNLQ